MILTRWPGHIAPVRMVEPAAVLLRNERRRMVDGGTMRPCLIGNLAIPVDINVVHRDLVAGQPIFARSALLRDDLESGNMLKLRAVGGEVDGERCLAQCDINCCRHVSIAIQRFEISWLLGVPGGRECAVLKIECLVFVGRKELAQTAASAMAEPIDVSKGAGCAAAKHRTVAGEVTVTQELDR